MVEGPFTVTPVATGVGAVVLEELPLSPPQAVNMVAVKRARKTNE
jgi:hypothetical protein